MARGLPPRRFFVFVAFLLSFWSEIGSQVQAQLIPQNQLSVAGVDSEQNQQYHAANGIDGNTKTMWHTTWRPIAAPFPHQITFKLSVSHTVTGLRYLPRQDGNLNGTITSYAVYVSPDGAMWDTPVARGIWPGNSAQKEIKFTGKKGRYVRLVATAAANRFAYTSAAEINLLGTPISTSQQPPQPTVTARTLSWVDQAANEVGFKIERKVNATGTFVQLAVVEANTTTYKDTDLAVGVTYCYRIQAFNAAGSSPFSNEACTGNQSIGTLAKRGSTSILSNNQSSSALQNTTSSLSLSTNQGSGPYDQSTVNQQRLFVQIGVFHPSTGTWYLDRNANGKFDDCNIDSCVNTFGVAGDLPVVGDWLGSGKSRLGVFNPATQMWDLDKNGDSIWEACEVDLCLGPLGTVKDLPVSGHWRAGSKISTIGIYRPRTGRWILDVDGNGRLTRGSGDTHLGPFGMPNDLPVAGDWVGIGKTHIGTFTPRIGQWRFDLNGNGVFDNCTIDRCVGPFGKETDYPIAADWTGDGITKIGTFDPSSGTWQLDFNGNGTFDGCTIDRCVGPFGRNGDLPVVGQW